MFANFTEFNIKVQPDVSIYGIKAGTGPPLLLLHGFPQTHHMWHQIAPALATSFTVIVMDLRGYGRSSQPAISCSASTSPHATYAKSALAADCIAVMDGLGITEPFYVAGHDRGGRVAHKLAVDFPDRVVKLMVLDICPTLAMYERANQAFATAYWHWFFLIQQAPFPETAILNNPDLFGNRFLGRKLDGGPGTWSTGDAEEVFKVYISQLKDEKIVHAMCEDYRAAATIDLVEARSDIEKARKIQCPVSVIWGKKGVIEACFDAIKLWQEVSSGKVTGGSVDSGHFIPEENSEAVLKHIKEFFV